MPSTRLDYAWMRTSVSLWFDDSLAVVMLVGLSGALNTTFFVVVFLVGCFEFAFMVSLLSLFFPADSQAGSAPSIRSAISS